MKKNILVVDDSALMRRVICDTIESDNRFQVADIAKNGLEAYNFIKSKTYDAVILDVMMPVMTGLELLEKLQKEDLKVPVIMASTLTKEGSAETIQALELGAFDFVSKPENFIEARGAGFRDILLSTLMLACDSNSAMNRSAVKIEPVIRPVLRPAVQLTGTAGGGKVVALACSTGGPKSLQMVIPYLPKNLDAPVLLVQHMPAGFTASLAERLNELSQVTVKEAEDGEVIRKGYVYIAPGGRHLCVRPRGKEHLIEISDAPPIGGLRPCANVMYESLIQSNYDQLTCVVLTGMGADGTEGITKLSRKKKIYVVAQNQETCVVYGMPKVVAEAGLVDRVTPLNEVADAITKNVGVR